MLEKQWMDLCWAALVSLQWFKHCIGMWYIKKKCKSQNCISQLGLIWPGDLPQVGVVQKRVNKMWYPGGYSPAKWLWIWSMMNDLTVGAWEHWKVLRCSAGRRLSASEACAEHAAPSTKLTSRDGVPPLVAGPGKTRFCLRWLLLGPRNRGTKWQAST